MVIALVLLSLAMIVGGLFAAFQGWEIVVLERGWSLVIAGSVTAASGALLLGVTAAVSRLEAVRREVAQLRDQLSRAELPSFLPPPPSLDPVDDLSASLLSGGGTPDGVRRTEEGEEPALPLFMRRPDERDGDLPRSEPEPADPQRTEPENGPRAEEGTARGARAIVSEAPRLRMPGSLFRLRRDEERAPEELEQAGPMRAPEPDALPEPRREPEPATVETEGEPGPAPTIVGSYNAGDNRYVMYSDGSIEADTPRGVFRFGSLDELKQFIAAGGDRPPTAP
jgi:hypothetical protein